MSITKSVRAGRGRVTRRGRARFTLLLVGVAACVGEPPSGSDSPAPRPDPIVTEPDSGSPPDADGDGWRVEDDCDDQEANTHPGADEICDDRDNDCDGRTDEDAIDAPRWWFDADADGYGDPMIAVVDSCSPGWRRVANDDDCDDSRAESFPGAAEVCDRRDNDCDGVIDDEPADPYDVYVDADGDGCGAGVALQSCVGPGFVRSSCDCDDDNATIHEGAPELCAGDGVDEDCDGLVDDADPDVVTSEYFPDDDGDGYGRGGAGSLYCTPPPGFVAATGDCDDGDPGVNPVAAEFCDDATGKDENCDGVTDPGCYTGRIWVDKDSYARGMRVDDCSDEWVAAYAAETDTLCPDCEFGFDADLTGGAGSCPLWYLAGTAPEATFAFNLDPVGDVDDEVWLWDGYWADDWALTFDTVETSPGGTVSFSIEYFAVSYDYGDIVTYAGYVHLPP